MYKYEINLFSLINVYHIDFQIFSHSIASSPHSYNWSMRPINCTINDYMFNSMFFPGVTDHCQEFDTDLFSRLIILTMKDVLLDIIFSTSFKKNYNWESMK